MLDGFDNNQGTQNAQSLSSQVVQPNPDAIEQFKVQTNSFSAEFGRSAGAVVNVSIKSGTNASTGSALVLQPRCVAGVDFVEREPTTCRRTISSWHQGGGDVRRADHGKNKLFYFGSYEGFRRSFSQSGIISVPDATLRHTACSRRGSSTRRTAAQRSRTTPSRATAGIRWRRRS